jgi:nucleoid-associated protein YgaU
MGVEKAALTNTVTGEVVPVMFNPEEYAVERSNNFAQLDVPGLATPPLQYVRGSGGTLSMELFFDTTADKSDVRRATRRVASLLDKQPATQAPPLLLFIWGGLAFQCVLEKVSQRFTLFREDGTPIRATLSVTFREHEPLRIEIEERGILGASPAGYLVKAGQTLSQIAGELFGDPGQWRRLADANDVNPRDLPAGLRLTIPS